MRLLVGITAAGAIALLSACAKPAGESQAAASDSTAAPPSNVTADLLTDVSQLEEKVMGLARAIPESKYTWRPEQGVRSVSEVFRHIASDNYLMPAASLGASPDSATGIKGDDYKTATAFEQRKANRDSTIADLQKSFGFLKQSFQNVSPATLGEKVTLFGQSFTRQQALILTATHLHEHLGQLIAYARSNGVTPPWSQ